MAQYREYSMKIRISDTDITIVSLFGTGNEIANNFTRTFDAAEVTNFKNYCEAHRQAALSSPATSITPPSYVVPRGRLLKNQVAATITTNSTTVKVPAGNSGSLKLLRDAGTWSLLYSINGGSFVAFTDGTNVTFTDGQTLTLKATGLTSGDSAAGSILDNDTGTLVDVYNLFSI